MKIRKACSHDIDDIMSILDEARAFQRQSGFRQWEDGYPGRSDVERDIDCGTAYAFIDTDMTAVGYVALSSSDEAYDRIGDIWEHSGNYGVVHRLALGDRLRGQHTTSTLFSLIEQTLRSLGITSIRLDTGTDNKIMQYLMAKYGYTSRGIHQFPWGPRLAYEKRL